MFLRIIKIFLVFILVLACAFEAETPTRLCTIGGQIVYMFFRIANGLQFRGLEKSPVSGIIEKVVCFFLSSR